ncbi:uncharacterized protein LOC143294593 [Babylonia areolata]|uniref:uncharacterized protein LOC143294593 n=1 Tax=Babylonia areolata TaxID=304850 RepID=UPI003FD238BD
MAPLSARVAADDDTVSLLHGSGGGGKASSSSSVTDKAAGTLTLKRKVALSAGLMASEAMAVFSTLNTMPLLQALGCPTYLLTLPGVLSAACGLAFVPLVGWLADRGLTPQSRKKPTTVAAFCVGLLGLCLNLSAAVLSAWDAQPSTTTANSVNISDRASSSNGSDSSNYNSSLLNNNNNNNQSVFSGVVDTYFPTSNESQVPSGVAEESGGLSSVSAMVSHMMGVPFPVLVSMAGFVFTDFAFDLSNSAVKALMLTHSAPADHVSLLVIGVFLGALGGCTTSLFGLVDLGALLPDVNPICSQAVVQLSILILQTIACCTCSLLSTPSLSQVIPQHLTTGQFLLEPNCDEEEEEEEGEEDGEGGRLGDGGRTLGESWRGSSLKLRTDPAENVFFATMTPAEALMTNSTQVERSFMHLSMSTSLSQSHHLHTLHPNHPENDKLRPSLHDAPRYDAIPEQSEAAAAGRGGSGVASGVRVKLLVVWLVVFFTGCGIFVFTVTLADVLGKAVYKGDPEAEAGSAEYWLYQQGVRTASLCFLILNVAYVAAALLQNKVLAAINPKTEYVLVSLCFMALLWLSRYTASLYAIVACSAVAGLSRTAMYTVPFILATQLCQAPPAENLSPEEGQGRQQTAGGEESGGPGSSFGSTMALVTSALPMAYLVTSSVIGPLVDATGDPSAPLVMGTVCLGMSALAICCYRSHSNT